jgi:hypothetical protein
LFSLKRRKQFQIVIVLVFVPSVAILGGLGHPYIFNLGFLTFLFALPFLFDVVVALKTKLLYHPHLWGEGEYITMKDGKFNFCFWFIFNIVISTLLLMMSYLAYSDYTEYLSEVDRCARQFKFTVYRGDSKWMPVDASPYVCRTAEQLGIKGFFED